jgi:DNA end-binding protein Ku
MSSRPTWKGMLSFGVVNIPIAAFKAVEDADEGSEFNLLHATCKTRITSPRRCAKCDIVTVPQAEIVRGYEYAPGQYVTFTDDEIKAIRPKSTHNISIEYFLPAEDISVLYFDKPNYLSANGPVGAKALATVRDAMRETGKVGIGTVAVNGHDNLVIVRPEENALVMQRIREAKEVRSIADIKDYDTIPAESDPRHLSVAMQIIEGMTSEFDPTLHEDSFRKEKRAAIERKIAGEEYTPPNAEEPTPVIDVMAALEATLAQQKAKPKKIKEVAVVAAKKKAMVKSTLTIKKGRRTA